MMRANRLGVGRKYLLAAGMLWWTAAGAFAQYPKINLAVGYQVDPSWPRRPDGVKCAS